MVERGSGIPPIEPQMTAIATNIAQTHQTPLDQKVALKKAPEKLEKQRKRRASDQVKINRHKQIILKERRVMEVLRELQMVVLFSQLMEQGLKYLIENASSMIYLLSIDELSSARAREELPGLFDRLRALLRKELTRIEKEQKELSKTLPYVIYQTKITWQVAKKRELLPEQKKLLTFEAELEEITFPDMKQQEVTLERLTQQQIELEEMLPSYKTKIEIKEKAWNEWEKQLEGLQQVAISLNEWGLEWDARKREKQEEKESIEERLKQVQYTHPLRRKNREHEANVLQEQLVEQDLRIIEEQRQKSQQRINENQVAQQKTKESVKQAKRHYEEQIAKTEALEKQIAALIQQEIEMIEQYEQDYQTSYAKIKGFFEEQREELYLQQKLSWTVEESHRVDLMRRLDKLKKELNRENTTVAQHWQTFQKTLSDSETVVLLSQANADARTIQQIFEKKKKKRLNITKG